MPPKLTPLAEEITKLVKAGKDPYDIMDEGGEREELLRDITDDDGFWYTVTLGGGFQDMMDLVFDKDCHQEFWDAVRVVLKYQNALELIQPEV